MSPSGSIARVAPGTISLAAAGVRTGCSGTAGWVIGSVASAAVSFTLVCAGFLVECGAVFLADFVGDFDSDFVRLGVFRIVVLEIYPESGRFSEERHQQAVHELGVLIENDVTDI